jgi:hypothetical protein
MKKARYLLALLGAVGLVISLGGMFAADDLARSANWFMACFVFGCGGAAAIAPLFFKPNKDGKKC